MEYHGQLSGDGDHSPSMAAGLGELILLVNGRMAHWQTPLSDGDVLKLVPAIGGGIR